MAGGARRVAYRRDRPRARSFAYATAPATSRSSGLNAVAKSSTFMVVKRSGCGAVCGAVAGRGRDPDLQTGDAEVPIGIAAGTAASAGTGSSSASSRRPVTPRSGCHRRHRVGGERRVGPRRQQRAVRLRRQRHAVGSGNAVGRQRRPRRARRAGPLTPSPLAPVAAPALRSSGLDRADRSRPAALCAHCSCSGVARSSLRSK